MRGGGTATAGPGAFAATYGGGSARVPDTSYYEACDRDDVAHQDLVSQPLESNGVTWLRIHEGVQRGAARAP